MILNQLLSEVKLIFDSVFQALLINEENLFTFF